MIREVVYTEKMAQGLKLARELGTPQQHVDFILQKCAQLQYAAEKRHDVQVFYLPEPLYALTIQSHEIS